MSLLTEYVLLASQNEALKDREYITEVLGIQIPLNESYPFSVGLEARILHEHMLLEGFFDGLKKLKDDALLFGKSLKEIISNPERIGAFVGALHKSVIKRMLKPIKSFFKMIMEKFPKAMKEKFPTFIKAAESTLSFIDAVVEKVMSMDGWKKAIATMALALGMKYIWDQVGELIEKGKEKLKELVPFLGEFDAIDAAGLNEDDGMLEKAKEAIKSFVDWFKDKIIGQVVDFVKDKLKEIGKSVVGDAISGGVKKAWDILTTMYGGAKFVMGTLAPAFKRFGRSSKQDGKITKESLLREYIRELLTESAIDPRIMAMIDRVENEGLIITLTPGAVAGSVEIENAAGKYLGGVDYEDPDPTDGFCYGAKKVSGSEALEGLGPLLYDIAIEQSGGLMADRVSVSGEAEAVWNKYMSSRSDVQVIQLDITDEFVDELDGITKLTPNEPTDDCSQVPAYDRHKSEWHESPLAKKYMKKNGTPVMDELRKRGLLA